MEIVPINSFSYKCLLRAYSVPGSVLHAEVVMVIEPYRSLTKRVYVLMVSRNAQSRVRAHEMFSPDSGEKSIQGFSYGCGEPHEGEWRLGSSVGERPECGHNHTPQGCQGPCKALWFSLVGKETRASARGQAAQWSSVDTQSSIVVWKLIKLIISLIK